MLFLLSFLFQNCVFIFEVLEALKDNSPYQDNTVGLTMDDICEHIHKINKIPPQTTEDFMCILRILCLQQTIYECSNGHFKVERDHRI